MSESSEHEILESTPAAQFETADRRFSKNQPKQGDEGESMLERNSSPDELGNSKNVGNAALLEEESQGDPIASEAARVQLEPLAKKSRQGKREEKAAAKTAKKAAKAQRAEARKQAAQGAYERGDKPM